MSKAKNSTNSSLTLSVCFSVFVIVILPFLLLQPAIFEANFPNSNLLVGLLFSSVCLLGVAAVFYPKKCEKTSSFKENEESQRSNVTVDGSALKFEGHHPNCNKFDGNRVKIRGVGLCSACAGLFSGAIIALIGTAFYFFFETPFPLAHLEILLASSGVLLLGLAQFVFRGYIKLIVNASFVVGSFVTLIVADLIGGNLFIDLYVLGLIVFLLLTRIMISEWNNRRICRTCGSCEFFHQR